MTTKTTTSGDLPPVTWEPIWFIPVGDAVELSDPQGWLQWDLVVAQWDGQATA